MSKKSSKQSLRTVSAEQLAQVDGGCGGGGGGGYQARYQPPAQNNYAYNNYQQAVSKAWNQFVSWFGY
jgi:hypothetical protein